MLLLVGEQVSAGGQGAARRIQRVAGAAPVPQGQLLDSAATQFQALPGQPDDVKRMHHRDVVIQLTTPDPVYSLECEEPTYFACPHPVRAEMELVPDD